MTDLFSYSVEFVLGNESFVRNGQTISLYPENGEPAPRTGELSNWGISLSFLSKVQSGVTPDTIRNLTRDQAIDIYRLNFWNPSGLVTVTLPAIAAKVFDAEVNEGHPQGVRLLQAALGLITDGILGPETAAACNASDEPTLYAAFIRCATRRYQVIHDVEVQQYGQVVADKNLQEWLQRLAKQPGVYGA